MESEGGKMKSDYFLLLCFIAMWAIIIIAEHQDSPNVTVDKKIKSGKLQKESAKITFETKLSDETPPPNLIYNAGVQIVDATADAGLGTVTIEIPHDHFDLRD